MKSKENTAKLVEIPEMELLSLVADKLKDRVLFPEKLEQAKEYLKNVEFVTKVAVIKH